MLLATLAGAHAAQAPKPPELAQLGKPDAAEAARLIEEVRQAGIAGEYFLEFQLQSLPRRGTGKTFRGALWGGRNAQGVVLRIEVTDAAGAVHRFLLQNGERPTVTRWADGRPVPLEPAQWLGPIVPGIEVSVFDLQMPYLYWPNPVVEKITRSAIGRPANRFLFKPPPEFAAQHHEIGAVRANLDTQFNALVQAEVFGPDAKPLRSFALLSVKRIGNQVVPKQVDYRNERTRDKTRLQVTAAALPLSLAPETFDPATLGRSPAPPSAAQIVRIEP